MAWPGNHEPMPPRSLTAGKIINQRPPLLFSDLYRCIHAKAPFPWTIPDDFSWQEYKGRSIFRRHRSPHKDTFDLRTPVGLAKIFLDQCCCLKCFLSCTRMGSALVWWISQLPPAPHFPSPAFAPRNLLHLPNSMLAFDFQMTWTNTMSPKEWSKKRLQFGTNPLIT